MQRPDEDFKVWDECTVKLTKTHEARNISNHGGSWPQRDALKFGHSRPITVGADVDANKFDSFWEDVAFFQAQ